MVVPRVEEVALALGRRDHVEPHLGAEAVPRPVRRAVHRLHVHDGAEVVESGVQPGEGGVPGERRGGEVAEDPYEDVGPLEAPVPARRAVVVEPDPAVLGDVQGGRRGTAAERALDDALDGGHSPPSSISAWETRSFHLSSASESVLRVANDPHA